MSKGVFIEGITVEMLRNACLEAVEDLLVNGDMVDIEVNSTEWIPVSDRLPDIDQRVIICTRNRQITDGYRWNQEDWFCAWSEYNGSHIGDKYEFTQIVAWMPLPEPYKGGDTE